MTTSMIGVSLKMYFGHARARRWFSAVGAGVASRGGLGGVELFVLPTYLQLAAAIETFAGTRITVGAQDVAAAHEGPYTGEVSALELAEVGATLAAVGHAERRALFGETLELVSAKASAALEAGLTPIVCVGERSRDDASAAASVVDELTRILSGVRTGRVVVAYEPVWAIGAPEPAPVDHVAAVTSALRDELTRSADHAGSSVLYGGAARPGLLTELGDAVDGLFLGRFAHDPDALLAVLDEAVAREGDRRTAG